MPEPIRYRLMVLLAKIETEYATDPTPTGAANGILAKNVEISPMEGEDVSRELIQAFLGAQATVPTGLRMVLSFDTELAGSGAAGTAPKWGPLARGAGMAETIVADTSVAYTPVSEEMESLTLWFWIGSTKHVLTGARGGGEVTVNAQGIPFIRWTFTGLWNAPGEATRATPTLTGFQKPLVASKTNTPTFTVNSVPLVLRSYSLKFGNQVEPRLLIGRESVEIVDRAEAIDVVVEAVPLTTLDPFTLANAQTLVPVALVHGTVAGNIISLTAATCQVKRPTGYQNNQGTLEWPLALAPLPTSTGNDQYAITLT
jgi:hypothetical protein